MDLFKNIISSIRSIRSTMNVPPSKLIDLTIRCNKEQELFLNSHMGILKTLAKIEDIDLGQQVDKPAQSATTVVGSLELYISLGGLIDIEREKTRMGKRASEINRIISSINGKLSNENFINRAPENVINKERSNLHKLTAELEKIKSNMEML